MLSSVVLPATFSEAVERAVNGWITQTRVQRGLKPFVHDEILVRAARGHSQNMARLNFFDHDSPVANQLDVTARTIAAGGTEGNHGGNLYWCRGLADARVGGSVRAEWMTSEGHRDTVLSSEYVRSEVGAFRRGKEVWITLVCSDWINQKGWPNVVPPPVQVASEWIRTKRECNILLPRCQEGDDCQWI